MPEIVNAEMKAAWDGAQGDEWVEREERMNQTLRAHTEPLLAAAGVTATDHVLDVGCGCGETTRACAIAAVGGRALGIDLSTAMLARARLRAEEEGIANVEFVRGDAQLYPFAPEGFDLVVSRFGVMFFDDPAAAFANIASAVKPGGRLALMVWQELARNEWITALRTALAVGRTLPELPPGAPGPFGLADADRTGGILEAAGFRDVTFDDVAAPFFVGTDTDDAFDFARGMGPARGLLDDLDADATARALDELRATLDAHHTGDGVVFDSRIWVITAVR